jgi:hypothetical protein
MGLTNANFIVDLKCHICTGNQVKEEKEKRRSGARLKQNVSTAIQRMDEWATIV